MATSQRLDRRYWELACNAGVASYLDAAILVSAGIALPLWVEHLELNTWWAGAASTILTLSVAVGSLFGGRLSDVFGKVTVFNLDILFVVIGGVVTACAVNLPMLIIGLIVMGLASGADLPTSLAVIAERVPDRYQGKVISVTELFWLAGIILSQGIGFLVAGIAMAGVAIMFMVIASIALITWLMRVLSPRFKRIEEELYELNESDRVAGASGTLAGAYPLSALLKSPRYLSSLAMLAVFYLMWNIPANTWGSFQTYFMVEIGGRSQSFATACGFIANVLADGVTYTVFVRFADTKHRYRIMFLGLVCGISAFCISAFAGGQWMVFTVCYFMFSMTNTLHGEPIYKIWSQQLFPANARATATGFTYAAVRLLTAAFGLVTPTLMSYSPSLLLWILVASLCFCILAACCVLRFIRKHNIADPLIHPELLECGSKSASLN